jgi:hypothetical protein
MSFDSSKTKGGHPLFRENARRVVTPLGRERVTGLEIYGLRPSKTVPAIAFVLICSTLGARAVLRSPDLIVAAGFDSLLSPRKRHEPTSGRARCLTTYGDKHRPILNITS